MPVREATNDTQTIPLIGREDVLAAVKPLFRGTNSRLITVTGPAGVGKTRLATELLAIHGEPVGRETVTIDLSAVSDPNDLDAELARAADISSVGETSLRATVDQWLTNRDAIILLDNAEHLLGIGPRVAEWLAGAHGIRVLVTSRKRLNLSMEAELELQPLQSDTSGASADISPAATMFAAIAGCYHPARLPADTRSLVEQLVHHLEGLPLSIELTAAQLPRLDAEHVANLLENIDAMTRSLPAVATALDVAVMRSYDLLTPPARTLLRLLTVFTGGFTVELVERFAAHVPALHSSGSTSPDLLDELAAHHLVLQEDGRNGPRFTMPAMVSHVVSQLREGSGETESARAAHASAVMEFTAAREYAGLRPGHEHEAAELSANFHNIMAAIAWFHERDRRDALVRLIGSLTWSWYSQGHYANGLHQFERVIALNPPQHGAEWAQFSLGYGVMLDIMGRFEEGREAILAAIAAYEAAGETNGIAIGNIARGFNAFHLERYSEAQTALETTIALARTMPERDFGNALEAMALANLGTNAQESGDPITAEVSLRRAIWLHEDMRFQWGTARGLCDLGGVLRDSGQHAEALATYQRALELAREVGDHRLIAVALSGVATEIINDGQHRLGAWLFGSVAALRPIAGKPSFLRANGVAWRKAREKAQAAIGDDHLRRAWAAGAHAPLHDVIETARRMILLGPNPFPPTRQPLTTQERYVLRMILQDQTTATIASLLGVHNRTVGSHLAAIFRKYGVNSRLELMALASQHRMAQAHL